MTPPSKIKTTITANRERAHEVYARLEALYTDVHCTLNYKSPFQLVIMTAQPV